MTLHMDDELLPYVLGIIGETQSRTVEDHVEGCTRCTHLLTETRDEVALLAVSLDPVVAPALLREEILHAIGEVNRFSGATDAIAERLHISRSEVETLLDDLDNPAAWQRDAQTPVWLYTVERHPEAAFVRTSPGCAVTGLQQHGGSGLILQGSCRDGAGRTFGVGDTLSWIGAADEEVDYTAQSGPDFICLIYEPAPPKSRDKAAGYARRSAQASPSPK